MGHRTENLKGVDGNESAVAILLIDVINSLDFPGSERLMPSAKSMANQLSVFCGKARNLQIPIIYVNDNFGRWRSDLQHQVDRCLNDDVPGKEIVEQLIPKPTDYFVLKPKHSGFYSTSLELLLNDLQVNTLVITGLVTNICVLFTANDAYMRGYRIWVPSDCSAAVNQNDHDVAPD